MPAILNPHDQGHIVALELPAPKDGLIPKLLGVGARFFGRAVAFPIADEIVQWPKDRYPLLGLSVQKKAVGFKGSIFDRDSD